MTWNRSTITTLVIVVVSVVFAAVLFRVTDDGSVGSPSSDGPPASSPRAGEVDPESRLPWVELTELPVEAQGTVALIDQGGPFPCAKDGSTFGNFEGLLPEHERGYYAEYTVIFDCSGNRGARRIVAGDRGELFYTDDHYESFERILR